ncbi:prepilin-type N-terminal cleavage/methylation domain-containing protein [Thiotrichales bacterium 19S3-7]|nr:prepilin-type N-terminal cleavage/methylation domain-containing protein [Thiotrichales bacterium 19S3-7]MCF6801181.1 prepilin-type N-terminal cleavage/methylation domain-containing protein [Thiotrichales bacterium 19S3-11]
MIKISNGFSLIELLIAMSLGGIVMAFAIRDYSLTSYQYNKQVSLLNSKTNQLNALEIIIKSIDKAGMNGYSNLNASRFEIVDNASNASALKPIVYVVSHTNNKAISELGLMKKGSGEYVAGNDILVIHSSSDSAYSNPKALLKGSNMILLPGRLKLKVGDTIVIATYNRFYYFDVKKIENAHKQMQRVFLNFPLNDEIPKDSIISKFTENVFYIGQSSRKENNTQIKSLYVKYQNKRYEVIENLAHLEIACLIQKENQLMTLPADAITNWGQLKAIQLRIGNTTNLINRLIAIQQYRK